MLPKKKVWIITLLVLYLSTSTGCINLKNETTQSEPSEIPETSSVQSISTIIPTTAPIQLAPAPDLSDYAFPDAIDPGKQYMFYLHGKIIEDQGIPAVSPDFGPYEYEAILGELAGYGFEVISKQRSKNTNVVAYARKIIGQITDLLNAGVPAENIIVLGASKGAAIAIYVSHLLANDEVNYVIMAICHPDEVEALKQERVILHGNVLSIYDACDEFAGSCQELFESSEGKGLSNHEEIILGVGLGHGILYQPMDEWIAPVIQWIGRP